MTAKRNKQYCDKCYQRVNKARLSRCTKEDCGLDHLRDNVIPINFKKPQQTHVLQLPVPAPVDDDMIELKLDAPEYGTIDSK